MEPAGPSHFSDPLARVPIGGLRSRRLQVGRRVSRGGGTTKPTRSEEHTSELQSLRHLVCRLLLEKKKKNTETIINGTLNSEIIQGNITSEQTTTGNTTKPPDSTKKQKTIRLIVHRDNIQLQQRHA